MSVWLEIIESKPNRVDIAAHTYPTTHLIFEEIQGEVRVRYGPPLNEQRRNGRVSQVDLIRAQTMAIKQMQKIKKERPKFCRAKQLRLPF